jgi:serpin B
MVGWPAPGREEVTTMKSATDLATRAAALLMVAGLVWGCTGSAAAADIALATSQASRAPASPELAGQTAAAVNAFGLDLYRQAGSSGNVVLSPTSIAIALAMARAGARGETASQMDAVLHWSADTASGNGVNSLDQALAALSGTFPDEAGQPMELRLHIANAPFGQKGMAIEAAYLDVLASRYGAGLRLVDFQSDTENARKLINGWVKDQTEKRIPELLQSLDPMTRLVLVNAIYLKAPWETAFREESTQDVPFTKADGSPVSVPTMMGSPECKYAAGTGWQAVELPYVGGSLAMTIVVPDDLAAFEQSLDAAAFSQITSALAPRSVTLYLPRFGTETRVDLADTLAAMGMTDAFDPVKADFSGITTDEQLYISNVVHQANIDVDEKGTEAAAATAVVMRATAIPGEPVTLHVDKPFLFAVRDTRTGAILFLGRISDPSK